MCFDRSSMAGWAAWQHRTAWEEGEGKDKAAGKKGTYAGAAWHQQGPLQACSLGALGGSVCLWPLSVRCCTHAPCASAAAPARPSWPTSACPRYAPRPSSPPPSPSSPSPSPPTSTVHPPPSAQARAPRRASAGTPARTAGSPCSTRRSSSRTPRHEPPRATRSRACQPAPQCANGRGQACAAPGGGSGATVRVQDVGVCRQPEGRRPTGGRTAATLPALR